MSTSNVVRFPTTRKRAYPNPRLRELPEGVTRLVRKPREMPAFPSSVFCWAMLSTLDGSHRLRVCQKIMDALHDDPERQGLQDAREWLLALPWATQAASPSPEQTP